MSEAPSPAPRRERRALFIAGTGRSGTSTLSGLMRILGLYVPQPELVADATNPRGFGEPQWMVDFHYEVLREAVVQVSDSRPAAWARTAEVGERERVRERTSEWLAEQFQQADEVVLKDPRLAWFLPLWRVAAERAGATPVFATMLRAPAEVVTSKQTYYENKLGPAHLTASWLNMQLHVEHATRPVGEGAQARVFLRYTDLLEDWVGATQHAGRVLGLRRVLEATPDQLAAGHGFVDPSLRRMDQTLDGLGLPVRLRELTEETWAAMSGLADPDGDTPAAHATLDDLRGAYVELYAEAEAISRSSVVAVEQLHRLQARRARKAAAADPPADRPADPRVAPPAGASPAPHRPPRARGADRVPHRVRALVPERVRRGVRRVLGRPR